MLDGSFYIIVAKYYKKFGRSARIKSEENNSPSGELMTLASSHH
jgi:hypothetical protein